MRNVHDMGCAPTDEPIDISDHKLMDWELKTYGVVGALGEKGLLSSDELRRGIESLPPEKYKALSYFERWTASIEKLLVEKGVLTTDEVDQKVKTIEERWA